MSPDNSSALWTLCSELKDWNFTDSTESIIDQEVTICNDCFGLHFQPFSGEIRSTFISNIKHEVLTWWFFNRSVLFNLTSKLFLSFYFITDIRIVILCHLNLTEHCTLTQGNNIFKQSLIMLQRCIFAIFAHIARVQNCPNCFIVRWTCLNRFLLHLISWWSTAFLMSTMLRFNRNVPSLVEWRDSARRY